MIQQSTPKSICGKKNEKKKKKQTEFQVHVIVHCSTIYNSQDLEET